MYDSTYRINERVTVRSIHNFIASTLKWMKDHPLITGGSLIGLTVVTGGTFIVALLIVYVLVAPLLGIYYLIYLIKTYKYYGSEEFRSIKAKLASKIIEYNEFDNFMSETREFILSQQQKITSSNVRDSTLTVYKNSKLDIYKYIVKYFFINTKIDESTLQVIESILQKYETLEKTYQILVEEYEEVMGEVREKMYPGAYIFKSLTMRKLGSRKPPKFKKDYYIWYSFKYTSPANRKYFENTIVLDEDRLQDFAEYLNNLIKYRKSVKYQRQLMTSKLRQFILERDDHTCKICTVSARDQSHLLLEVDHIVPVSKGGITVDTNLQALCWKCNRSKSNKLMPV